MIRRSIKSKRSTALDTATRKNRWLRIGAGTPELPEFGQLLDLYWSGPERRISALTVRIIGMNAFAMLLLLVGIVSLSEYQKNLIDAKLQSFNAEMQMAVESISEIALGPDGALDKDKAERIVRRLIETAIPQRIQIFDTNGALVLDSRQMDNITIKPPLMMEKNRLYSAEVLKSMAAWVIEKLPGKRSLPVYPFQNNPQAEGYPDVPQALDGHYSLSAWTDRNKHIFLSGAGPLHKAEFSGGAVLLTRSARDINDEIGDMWLNIVAAFVITLIVTVLISIYLSGVISSPLKRLARAAEGVRKGLLSLDDMPDFSDRNDEIGELSLAFRDMMNALWSRMDSIERFAADVAHELKNPLTSLKSAVETVSIVKKKEDREKLMGIIRHDIDRLDRLITDISHASRLDSELSRDVYTRVNVHRVLQNLLGAYADPLARKNGPINEVIAGGVRIKYEPGHTMAAYIWGLESRLEQVFQNILANALSFSDKGKTVYIRLEADSVAVRVTIEDEGPGIPEKNLKTVFDRFYTERPAHEGYGRHSGLGLSICKQIVTAMGGDIYAENAKNRAGHVTGARFVVILKKS